MQVVLQDSDIQIREQVGSFWSAIPTKWQAPHPMLDKSSPDLFMSLRHDVYSQDKCHSSWCLLMHLYVTVPWSSLSSGTERLFILFWITLRYFYWGCLKVKKFCKYDPRANSTKTSEKQNTPINFKAFFLAMPQQAFWFIPHWHAVLLKKGHVHTTTGYYNRWRVQKSDRSSSEFNPFLL